MADNLPIPAQPARVVPGTVTGPSVYYRYSYRNTGSTGYRFGTSRGAGSVPSVPSPAPSARGRIGGAADFISRNSGTFKSIGTVPRGVPRFLAQRRLLLAFWLVSLILVSSDEVNHKFIPPRPLRLWYASITYFVLFLVAQIDSMVPLCNALGGGFVVTLLYENITGNTFTLFGIPLTGSSSGSSSGTGSSGTGSSGSALTPGTTNLGQSVWNTLQQNIPTNSNATNLGQQVWNTLQQNIPTTAKTLAPGVVTAPQAQAAGSATKG